MVKDVEISDPEWTTLSEDRVAATTGREWC